MASLDVDGLLSRIASLEAELRSLEIVLESCHRQAVLGTLVGYIAHEFNNLLTPMQCAAQEAIESPRDAANVERALRIASIAADRGRAISEAILALARPEVASGEVAVHEAIAEALLCLARPLERDRIKLITEVPSGCCVRMNAAALQQVLLNLVLNARSALRRSGGTIAITVTVGSGETAIVVEDSGIGMSADVLQSVQANLTGPSDQVGLGLAICGRLMKQAGGSIHLESVPGRGTRVTLSIPSVPSRIAA